MISVEMNFHDVRGIARIDDLFGNLSQPSDFNYNIAKIDTVLGNLMRHSQGFTSNNCVPFIDERRILAEQDQLGAVQLSEPYEPLLPNDDLNDNLGNEDDHHSENLRRETTSGKHATLTSGGKPKSSANHHVCMICRRSFRMKKTLARHLRSVHRPKAFACSECNQTFIRKDTLSRHISEQHGEGAPSAKCLVCGRQVSKRALREHLDSKVCQESRALMCNRRFDGIGFKYPGQDDDAFLVAVRLFLTSKPQVSFQRGPQTPQLRLSLFVESPGSPSFDTLHWHRLHSRVVILMQEQMQRDLSALHGSDALWCVAMLLAILSIAGGPDPSARAHFRGARAILMDRHRNKCSCDCYSTCQNWRGPTLRDSATALLVRLFRERGISQCLKLLCHFHAAKGSNLQHAHDGHFSTFELFSKA